MSNILALHSIGHNMGTTLLFNKNKKQNALPWARYMRPWNCRKIWLNSALDMSAMPSLKKNTKYKFTVDNNLSCEHVKFKLNILKLTFDVKHNSMNWILINLIYFNLFIIDQIWIKKRYQLLIILYT